MSSMHNHKDDGAFPVTKKPVKKNQHQREIIKPFELTVTTAAQALKVTWSTLLKPRQRE